LWNYCCKLNYYRAVVDSTVENENAIVVEWLDDDDGVDC
jgi:hypothetical protein